MGQTEDLIQRRFDILQMLSLRRNGVPASSLIEHFGCSRATIYRDVKFLANFLPVVRQTVGDIQHICLLGYGQATTLKIEELAALRFAREMVQPLKGKWEVDALDSLLRKLGRKIDSEQYQEPTQDVAVVKAIDVAVENKRRISFQYRSTLDQTSKQRTVDPLALRLHSQVLYMIGHDVDKDALRTFKLSRVEKHVVEMGQSEPHPDFDEKELFAHSIGIWAGEPVTVSIQITKEKARFVREWPLTQEQNIQTLDSGDLLITALVAGLQEPLRWLLSWGESATAIAPKEFRDLAEQEISAMKSLYSDGVST